MSNATIPAIDEGWIYFVEYHWTQSEIKDRLDCGEDQSKS